MKIFYSSILMTTQTFFQNPQPQQDNIRPDQQQNTTLQNQPDSYDTDTIQNISEISFINTNNQQSFTKTKDSNVLQVPVRQVTRNTNNDLIQDNTPHYLHPALL